MNGIAIGLLALAVVCTAVAVLVYRDARQTVGRLTDWTQPPERVVRLAYDKALLAAAVTILSGLALLVGLLLL